MSNVAAALIISWVYKEALIPESPTFMNLLLIRGFGGGFNAFIGKYCMKLLSMSIFAVFSRVTVFVTILFTRVFLKEKTNKLVILLAVVAFVGITLNVDPTVIGIGTKTLGEEKGKKLFTGTKEEQLGVTLIGVFVTGTAATRILTTHLAHEYGMSATQNLFFIHFGLMHWSYLKNFNNPLVFHYNEIGNYALITMAGGCYQYCLINASKLEKNPAVILIIQNMLVVMSYACDTFLFGKEVTVWNTVGGALVTASSILTILLNKKEKEDKEMEE